MGFEAEHHSQHKPGRTQSTCAAQPPAGRQTKRDKCRRLPEVEAEGNGI